MDKTTELKNLFVRWCQLMSATLWLWIVVQLFFRAKDGPRYIARLEKLERDFAQFTADWEVYKRLARD